MHWVLNLSLVTICSTLVASLSNEEIMKVKNFYNSTSLLNMKLIFQNIQDEYVTDSKKDIIEHYVYGRPNPCGYHAKSSDILYRFSKVEMKVIRAAIQPWMVTLDDETYFPVPILIMCELSTILEGVAGFFTLMLLDPELHTFLQVSDYPWGGVERGRAPLDVIYSRFLQLNYLDNGHAALTFLQAIQDEEMDLFQFCDMLRRHDYIIGSTHHVVKGGVKIQDYNFLMNRKRKINVPGVLYCEIEYNENVTKVFGNIAPGTKDVFYYVVNRPILGIQLTHASALEFFKAKPLEVETGGKEALVWC